MCIVKSLFLVLIVPNLTSWSLISFQFWEKSLKTHLVGISIVFFLNDIKLFFHLYNTKIGIQLVGLQILHIFSIQNTWILSNFCVISTQFFL